MVIVVFLKPVIIDPEIKIKDIKDYEVQVDGKYVINEYDLYAIELALNLKKHLNEKILGIFLINDSKENIITPLIWESFARGIDDITVIIIKENINLNDFEKARIFYDYIKKEKIDLTIGLTGVQSVDTANSLLGAYIAAMLGYPFLASINQIIDINNDSITVKRDVENGFIEKFSIKLPAILSVQSGFNKPQYVPYIKIMGSRNKKYNKIYIENTITTQIFQNEKLTLNNEERKAVKIISGDSPEEKAKILAKILKELSLNAKS
ncbi:MAG: electron transfer flavoprotein subunit beta/FixA family protein [Nitrososphaeria archaeon]